MALSLLVVDDIASDRRILTLALRQQAFDITEVENGQAALDFISEGQHFDMAFVDLQLPDMDGLEIVAALRALSQKTHIIICTASDSTPLLQTACEYGSNAYLVKPFGLGTVQKVLQQLGNGKGDEGMPIFDDHTGIRYFRC